MRIILILTLISCSSFAFSQEAIDTLVNKACTCYETGSTDGFNIEDVFPTCVYSAISARKNDYKAIIATDEEIKTRGDVEMLIIKKLIFECSSAHDFYKKNLYIAFEAAVKETLSSLDELNEDILRSPDDGEIYSERGLVYLFIEKDYAKALQDLNKAIELENDNEALYAFRGIYYHMTGNYFSAIQDFEKALKIENEPIFYILLYLAQLER